MNGGTLHSKGFSLGINQELTCDRSSSALLQRLSFAVLLLNIS